MEKSRYGVDNEKMLKYKKNTFKTWQRIKKEKDQAYRNIKKTTMIKFAQARAKSNYMFYENLEAP
jgi:hypothetical protein